MPFDLQESKKIRTSLDIDLDRKHLFVLRLLYTLRAKINNITNFSEFVKEKNEKKKKPSYGDKLFTYDAILHETEEIVQESLNQEVEGIAKLRKTERLNVGDLIEIFQNHSFDEVKGLEIKIENFNVKISVELQMNSALTKVNRNHLLIIERCSLELLMKSIGNVNKRKGKRKKGMNSDE